MGLPLTPELARMCTAYLLKDYEPPIGEALTLYFDDVAATYPINTLPLKPFNLLPTIDNTTQDATYDTTKKEFLPLQQKYRQAVPLHPHSFHLSTKLAKKTYFGAAFLATQIAHNPAEALDYMLRKYLPALQRLGHDCTEVVENMVRIIYFPKRTEKKDIKYTPSIQYQFSDTRPIKSQLQPYQNNNKEYKLQPVTPMPPILKLLCYVPKRNNPNHSVFPCPNYNCIMCRQYENIENLNTNINVPIIPCLLYRSTYILFKRNEEHIRYAYIGTTNLQKTNICNVGKYNRININLMERKNIGWQ